MDTSAWSAQQLAEYLAVVSAFDNERDAMFGAVELAAEAFEAEIGAIVSGETVLVDVGFPSGRTPERQIVEAVVSGAALDVPGPGI
ncbi:MAG TPA: hypothetical protein VKR22_15985, partial [Acidimicrobiales bacterium]|nr:hypothetical protein [Acidimicrobiales bacterium]